jgi:signal transduction histidine kinase
MRESRWPLRACGTVGAASALGGCAGDAGPWLFGGLALVLCTAAAAGAGWLLGRHGMRQRLHLARQATRLLGELSGGRVWQVQGQPPRLDDGRRFDEVYDGGDRSAQIETQLGREAPFGPCMLLRRDGGPAEELSALPWYRDDGGFAGLLGLMRPAGADGAPQGHHAQALQALAEAWPDVLMLLQRRGDDEPWQRLQASPEALRRLGDAPLIAARDLQAQLPAALHATLAAPGDAEGEGWRLRHLRGEAPSGAPAMLLLWRSGDGAGDETASLSYTVSHDLRAPIRVVEGFARILKEDYSATLDRVAVDHLDRVLGAAARMNLMIDAMLTLARLSSQPLTRQPVNLSQLASYVIDDLRRAAPEREAVIQIDPELQTSGDPTLLRLVLENLLGNAWKYTAKRGQAHIVFARETVDGRAAYVVRDNGAGFDMRSAERLFSLFQRLHSANDFPGTGVGLASVRRIVQRHGGEIWADGEPGRGAAFYFRLRD